MPAVPDGADGAAERDLLAAGQQQALPGPLQTVTFAAMGVVRRIAVAGLEECSPTPRPGDRGDR